MTQRDAKYGWSTPLPLARDDTMQNKDNNTNLAKRHFIPRICLYHYRDIRLFPRQVSTGQATKKIATKGNSTSQDYKPATLVRHRFTTGTEKEEGREKYSEIF